MLSEAVRNFSRRFLEPLARFLSTTGVSPNVITLIGFVLMAGVAILLAKGYLFWGGILIIVAGLFDAIDGTLARMMGRTSRFGAFLDSTLDRFSEAIIYLGLFIYFIEQGQQLELILIYALVLEPKASVYHLRMVFLPGSNGFSSWLPVCFLTRSRSCSGCWLFSLTLRRFSGCILSGALQAAKKVGD
jgi:CDP-diacylglycerol--glycerol-3-phosphate 3-phosphatidyltransferase